MVQVRTKTYSGTIILLTVTFLIGMINPVIGQKNSETWLPFAPAPVGEFGGTIVTEFGQRAIDSDTIHVRRVMLRMGWTPTANIALWLEGGLASLYLDNDLAKMQGDFGTSVGAGTTLRWSSARIFGFNPYVSGRGSMFISRLGNEKMVSSGLTRTTRSRFEWWEGFGSVGFSGDLGGAWLYFGACCRVLYQKENRLTETSNQLTQTSASRYKEMTTYQSALQPGVAMGLQVPLKWRFNTNMTVEIYEEGFKAGFSIGQWGRP